MLATASLINNQLIELSFSKAILWKEVLSDKYAEESARMEHDRDDASAFFCMFMRRTV